MNCDRRKTARRPWLLRGELKWPGVICHGITTNVSTGGSFVQYSGPLPSEGAKVLFTFSPDDDEPPIEMSAVVIRAVARGAGEVPGVALAWLGARTEADPVYFARALHKIFGEEVAVAAGDDYQTWISDRRNIPDVAFTRAEFDQSTGRRKVVFARR